MFVSAGLDIQLHSPTEEGLDSHPIHRPPSQARIISVSFCNDNTYIAFLCENKKAQILSAKDPTNVHVVHTINVSNVCTITFMHKTKRTIAMGTNTGDVVIYNTRSRQVSNTMSKISEIVMALEFTCDDQQLCGLGGNTLFVFPDINASSNVIKYKQKSEGTLLKCHPLIANRVAIGCKNGAVSLWDVQNGVELFDLNVFPDCPVSGVTMSSCGNFTVVAGNDLKICGIDFDNASCNFNYKLEQQKSVTSVDLSPDDKYLAVGLADGTLKLYDITQQMKQVFCAKLHDSPVNVLAFENKVREPNSNFSSLSIKLSEEETSKRNGKQSFKKESLTQLKKKVLQSTRVTMDYLKYLVNEQFNKTQQFLDDEFETIDTKITATFHCMNQLIESICSPESSETHTE